MGLWFLLIEIIILRRSAVLSWVGQSDAHKRVIRTESLGLLTDARNPGYAHEFAYPARNQDYSHAHLPWIYACSRDPLRRSTFACYALLCAYYLRRDRFAYRCAWSAQEIILISFRILACLDHNQGCALTFVLRIVMRIGMPDKSGLIRSFSMIFWAHLSELDARLIFISGIFRKDASSLTCKRACHWTLASIR